MTQAMIAAVSWLALTVLARAVEAAVVEMTAVAESEE